MKNKALILFLFLTFSVTVFLFSYPKPQVVPVIFDTCDIPLISAEIEGKTCLLELDLESLIPLRLRKDIVVCLRKYSNKGWRDQEGCSYGIPSYIVSTLKLEDRIFENLLAIEKKDSKAILWEDEGDEEDIQVDGVLGTFLLRKENILLDFPQKRIVLLRCLNDIKGFDYKDMIKVPLEGDKGLFFNIETDTGKYRFILCTNTTVNGLKRSLLNASSLITKKHDCEAFTSNQLIIGGHDFGKTDFYLFPFLEVDGWLGMEFLLTHSVYIDYANRALYIKKS